jgi:hypothetical protein
MIDNDSKTKTRAVQLNLLPETIAAIDCEALKAHLTRAAFLRVIVLDELKKRGIKEVGLY